MMRQLSFLLLGSIIAASFLWAAPEQNSGKQKLRNLPVMGGSNEPVCDVRIAPRQIHHQRLDDYIGITDTAGTTYYDYQHNGTCGRMIDVDDDGMVSLVWMNGLTPEIAGPRHIYHNLWDPMNEAFLYDTIGIMVDASSRAGYVCQTALGNGLFCFAFHQITTGCCNAHATAAIPPVIIEPNWCYEYGQDLEIIWPTIDADINGNLHMMSTNNPFWEEPLRIFYSRGVPEFDPDGFPVDIHWDEMSCGGFEVWDTVMTISPDVACSRHSERCAVAWCHPMDDLNNDPSRNNNEIYLRISEDGGLNWGERINVTQWTPWDMDTGDTLRCYTDVSVLFDDDDRIHIAFTTISYLIWDPYPDWYYQVSKIFHWNEETGYYSLLADGWYESDHELGAYQRQVQRPCLAVEPWTGYLYCSYMKHDPEVYSEDGYLMADAFVTVSTNNGTHWAVGTNVTNTTPDVIPAPCGTSLHERDVTVAPVVTNGILHMEYVLDKDAGGIPQQEGCATLNPVIYQRIPVSEIPTSPLMQNYPMHWDSAGHPPDASAPMASRGLPEQFVLHQNYPNPFNPTTTIQFDLVKRAKASLRVYNVLGQEVETLLNDVPLSAGVHTVHFNASNLPSGIYIYRLESPDFMIARKMVLMK